MGICTFREGLPLTMRSSFHVLLGDCVWGWIGDLIDALSIVTTIAGICTSLGLGAIQIVAGLKFIQALEFDLGEEQMNRAQIAAIGIVTVAATVSVVSGVKRGIKTLSQIAFLCGLSLWIFVLCLDKTSYLLNLTVECAGKYFQYGILEYNFLTDSFGQLKVGEGRSTDPFGASANFMDSWTVFYWSWWTSWSVYVGMFVSRISRGRTIREVINYSLTGPVLYTITWFAVFGGAGLRSDRRASEVIKLGEDLFGDPMHNADLDPKRSGCFNPPRGQLVASVPKMNTSYIFVNREPNVGPVCRFSDVSSADNMWFLVLDQYYNLGFALSLLSLFSIAIYFVTSSDSGSLVVDFLASNGEMHHHWIQRFFWACTEGAVAFA